MKNTTVEVKREDILDKFLNKIEDLKAKQELTSEDKNFLFNSLEVLKDIFTDKEDQELLDDISNKLKSKQHLTLKDFENIDRFIQSLKNKEKEISQVELKRLQEVLISQNSFKKELSQVKEDVVYQNLNISAKKLKEIQQYKEKVINYLKEIKNLKEKYPLWTKVMLSRLPIGFVEILEGHKQDKESFTKIGEFFNQIKKFIESILVGILSVLFDFFAPQEVKQLVAKIKKDFSKFSSEDIKLLQSLLIKDEDYVKLVRKGDFLNNAKDTFDKQKENIKEYKDLILSQLENKLSEKLGIFSEKDKNKLKNVLEEWWEKDIAANRNELTKFSKEQIEKLSKYGKLDEISFDNLFFEVLGFSGVAFLKLIVKLTDEGLMKPGQLLLEVAEIGAKKGMKLVYNSFLFFPKVTTYVLETDKLSIEDIYNFVDTNSLSEQSKLLLLVGIYRAINTGWFRYLGYISSLPFYSLSIAASLGEDVKKTQLFFEGMRYENLEKQMKLLAEIESKLLNIPEKDGVFSHILKSIREYRKATLVSLAYQNSKNFEEFKKFLGKNNLLNDKDVLKLLEKLSETHFKTEEGKKVIATFLGKAKEFIKGQDLVSNAQWIQEFKKFLGPYFGRTKFYDDTLALLSESLDIQQKLLYKGKFGKLSEAFERFFRRFNYSLKITKLTDVKDALHFQDINSFRDFLEDMKIFVKESPHLARYFFRTFPIWILSADIINKIKNGDKDVKDIVEIVSTFIPIVGPIVFLSERFKDEGNLTNTDVGVALVWVGVDTFVLIKGVRSFKDLLVYMGQPVTDFSRGVLTLGQILFRLSKFGKVVTLDKLGKVESIEILVNRLLENGKFFDVFRGKMGTVAIILLILILGKKIAENIVTNIEKGKDLVEINLLKQLAQTSQSGTEAVNQYIFENWNNFDIQKKELLLGAYIGYYLGLSPLEVDKYLKDIKYDEKEGVFKIYFTDDAKNLDFRKRFEDLLPRLNILAEKLNIKIAYDDKIFKENNFA